MTHHCFFIPEKASSWGYGAVMYTADSMEGPWRTVSTSIINHNTASRWVGGIGPHMWKVAQRGRVRGLCTTQADTSPMVTDTAEHTFVGGMRPSVGRDAPLLGRWVVDAL